MKKKTLKRVEKTSRFLSDLIYQIKEKNKKSAREKIKTALKQFYLPVLRRQFAFERALEIFLSTS